MTDNTKNNNGKGTGWRNFGIFTTVAVTGEGYGLWSAGVEIASATVPQVVQAGLTGIFTVGGGLAVGYVLKSGGEWVVGKYQERAERIRKEEEVAAAEKMKLLNELEEKKSLQTDPNSKATLSKEEEEQNKKREAELSASNNSNGEPQKDPTPVTSSANDGETEEAKQKQLAEEKRMKKLNPPRKGSTASNKGVPKLRIAASEDSKEEEERKKKLLDEIESDMSQLSSDEEDATPKAKEELATEQTQSKHPKPVTFRENKKGTRIQPERSNKAAPNFNYYSSAKKSNKKR